MIARRIERVTSNGNNHRLCWRFLSVKLYKFIKRKLHRRKMRKRNAETMMKLLEYNRQYFKDNNIIMLDIVGKGHGYENRKEGVNNEL